MQAHFSGIAFCHRTFLAVASQAGSRFRHLTQWQAGRHFSWHLRQAPAQASQADYLNMALVKGEMVRRCGSFFMWELRLLGGQMLPNITSSGSSSSCWRKLGDHVRFMETNIDKTDLRRKFKEERMQEVRERQRLEREEYKARKIPTPEDILVRKIELAKKKVAQTRLLLKKFDVPIPEVETKPMAHHAPEILTPEERHFWKKMGQKYKNYVPVGRRGIYGGTIQNMHLHWKKHETVRVDCHMFSDEQIKVMAKDLAHLSGGIVVDIRKDKVVVLYRGSKYKQPKELIPKNLLDKRKALKKSLLEQSMNSVLKHIGDMEKKRRQMQLEMALEVENSSTVSGIALGDSTP
ncbi:hypothetical protein O6H91_07G023700 [Diphasiastrum complanatum]|uniref:Uncharacterized protein n=1 Tax=Diphasiastrum complanatum TaxID=34168 RepID=A0ACC2D3A3_DIPCM|nr:hypothetical protein O6H91_07G023700 [Diphasiastrum complanatum]